MEQLQIFKFNSNEVRTVIKNGEPWFVGKDVCVVFGDKNHNRSLARVDEEDKIENEIIDSMKRKQVATMVNESGLYSLLFQMQPQKANNSGVSDAYPIEVQERIDRLKKFKKWVTGEVLPSIRKHGAYMTEDVLLKSLSDPNYVIGLLTALSDSKKELNIKNQLIGELKPKADYLDLILKGKLLMTTSQISKDYGMSAQELNKILHRLGIQFMQNGQWLLYSKYHAQGYTSSKFIPITRSDGRVEMILNTQWTQKGRMFLYETLKENDILPMIERREN